MHLNVPFSERKLSGTMKKLLRCWKYQSQAITRSRAANSKKEVETKATLSLQSQLQNVLRYLPNVFLEFSSFAHMCLNGGG